MIQVELFPKPLAADVVSQVSERSGFSIVQPAGGKGAVSKPSVKGKDKLEGTRISKVEFAVSLALLRSVPLFGLDVQALKVCTPEVKDMVSIEITSVVLVVSNPVQKTVSVTPPSIE